MENFTNETLNLSSLPKFEEVNFSPLHKNYTKVVHINIAITLLIFAIGISILLYFNEELQSKTSYLIFGISYLVFALILFFGTTASVKRRGFAVREKDILYKRGLISTTTTMIPFNRIQHVAMHEGVFSRIFNLAQIQIFTAGGSTSDVKISGIEKEKAENIKELLMQKIQNEI
ncbi:PH domain-containing protein [uncultured Flavobacterium sp.]|uniref:PH domain-containing protein n=1 Tax=uncultured Flavobacterium sp. TaxID=165435 RepID=UPI0025FCB994|nr:PH domain-containing protein [uncultured Flavobacterium sp.]